MAGWKPVQESGPAIAAQMQTEWNIYSMCCPLNAAFEFPTKKILSMKSLTHFNREDLHKPVLTLFPKRQLTVKRLQYWAYSNKQPTNFSIH